MDYAKRFQDNIPVSDRNPDHVVELARSDAQRGDLRRAKDRLRSVLRRYPYHEPALELMGRIYYEHGDYRNAVMYWSRAGFWEEPMGYACNRVFQVTGRALSRENARAVRYHLYAFAGCSPPPDVARVLSACQSAYFRLGEKRSRLTGLACAPAAGGSILAILGLMTGVMGGGWSSFLWTGGIALVATLIVITVNAWWYLRAVKLFHESTESLLKGHGRVPH